MFIMNMRYRSTPPLPPGIDAVFGTWASARPLPIGTTGIRPERSMRECVRCGAATTSGALTLCQACSAGINQYEACPGDVNCIPPSKVTVAAAAAAGQAAQRVVAAAPAATHAPPPSPAATHK
jgi:hypothetical protein